MSFSNLSNEFIKDRANNLKSTVRVLEQSLESDKQRREKISREIVSLDQYCDKILKEINADVNECRNTEIMIGYLESCEKCRVSENESNFSFSQVNPLKFTEIELIGLLFSKRSSMRNTPIELLQLKPEEYLISNYDNYSLSELKSELIIQISKIFQNQKDDKNSNKVNHIYINEDEIDPFIPICPFELDGECSDAGCPFQHIKKTNNNNNNNNSKEEEKENENEKTSAVTIITTPLIVIPIPKNYNFVLKRKYRIEPLNSQIPLYYKYYNNNLTNNNNNNNNNEIKELLVEIYNNNNSNKSYINYKIPDSLQPALLLKYLLNLTNYNNNDIYHFYNQLKSNSKSLVFIDYVLKYISSILQSHRTVSYVWNIYLNFYFLRQWTNVKDILTVSKIHKDFCPYNVIGYCLIINELSHWNIDSVIMLNYYLSTCKECVNSIIKYPEENHIDLTFNLIKQLIYYSYSIGYYEVINSLFSSIIKSNNNNNNSSSLSSSYILDGGDIYYNKLLNIFSLSQISILFSLYLHFELYKQLPPYSLTNFPFYIQKIVIVKTQSQISSLYQCYKTLNFFCNEIEMNKYEINSYVDIYGLETIFYSYKWISELCQIEYDSSNYNHLNILKKEYGLFYKVYKLNNGNNNNNIFSDEDIEELKSSGYLSILTHYQLLNIDNNNNSNDNNNGINRESRISLKDNNNNKNLLHILLQWCNLPDDREMKYEEAIKYLYSRSEDAYKISINEIVNGIMKCVNKSNVNYNMLLNSVYTLEICCIIMNLYEMYIVNDENINNNNKYVDIIIEALSKINEKINYEKLLLISPYKSSISFMFQIHSILFKSLSLFECKIPISRWFSYIKPLTDKLELCFKDISFYFELNKSNENNNSDDSLQPLQIYNLCSYYHLFYGNNNNYIDSYLSTLFEIVKPFLNCNVTEGIISYSSNIPTYCLFLINYLWNNNEPNQIKKLISKIKEMELFQFDSIIPSLIHYDLLYSIYERCSVYRLFDLLEIYINYHPFQWKVWRYGMIVDVEYGDDQDATTYLVKEFMQRSLFIDPR